MGAFLKGYPTASRTWDEAEDALASFERWRKSLALEDRGGELGELGRMLAETEGQRAKEATLKQIVFEGPQDDLNLSTNAQPAILVTSIAYLRTLEVSVGAPGN